MQRNADMSPGTAVYIIDDDGALAEAITSLLDVYQIQAHAYPNTEQFLLNARMNRASQHCLLIALNSDCEGGLTQVRELQGARPELPIIVLCDTHDDDLRNQYIRLGATDVVSKSMVDAYVFTRLSTICPDTNSLPVTPASTMSTPDGTSVTIRMINPEDKDIEQQFVIALSERSRYLRFFSGLRRLPPYMLRQLVDPEFPFSYALIATIAMPAGEQQIGVARYALTQDTRVAEFAVVIADEWQGAGIASQLLRYVIAAATVAGLHQLEGLILRENKPMLALAEKLGFNSFTEDESELAVVKVVKNLR